ncbi:hypothetical protein DIURU_004536 [Diutina rugosa]|uniref:Dolichyl-phosphate-mannose--protein mannosyltransferase n=1 Tax=Diutina rugosa TaxID=5481 RepID=A0A642UGW4_DIURU|nr:uncharacterized protein DIURU_004536 [Diutina rugosa]KAA8898692.1 hypothetical protein DIURU_004536 [Diutina rugosa]
MAKPKSSGRKTRASKEDNWNEDQCVAPEFGKGPYRPYIVSTPEFEIQAKRTLHRSEYSLILVLMLVAFYVRMYGLTKPDSVVFDEVHFGGFARKYILGEYFMDVHPPLAKMLFAGVGALGGFKGNFSFAKIGDVYPKDVPYVLMRQFPAVLGIAVCLFCYLTLRQSGVRPLIAFFTTFLLIIDNAQVAISRYILLDSPLIFFIAAAAYAFKRFEIQKPFTSRWVRSLFATAIALGLAVSSKWVGLFTIAWVGVLCAVQMWVIVGDLQVKPATVVKHTLWRGIVLLGVPLAMYYFFFAAHFSVLVKHGDGASNMAPTFRATLRNNKLPTDIMPEVGYGSVITLRHVKTAGGYLHSHQHPYPGGSKQQQITLYPHIDENNNWRIEPYNASSWDNSTFVPLTSGTKIRLKHTKTGRRLHSHDHKPPVSERDWQKEVSCYGFEGFGGDANDDWIVEIVEHKSKTPEGKERVRATESVIRLKHAMSGHYLFSSAVKLPEWGFGQQEVSAASQGSRPLLDWIIETNTNEFSNSTEVVNYKKMTLWEKFAHSHARMWSINQNLKDHHPWQSNAIDWPTLPRGINYWVKDKRQVYLIGNAPIWYAVTATIAVFALYAAINGLRWQFGANVAEDKHVFTFLYQSFTYVLGWALHYFPFFIMGRQLFLHHYLPAYYFGLLALGQFFEFVYGYFGENRPNFQRAFIVFLTAFSIVSSIFYWQYSPFTYGLPQLKSQCEAKKFLNWDFDCNAMAPSWEEFEKYESQRQNPKAEESKVKPPNQGEFDSNQVVQAKKEAGDNAKVSPQKAEAKDAVVEEEPQLVPEFEEPGTDKADDSPAAEVEAEIVEIEEVDDSKAKPAELP